MRGAAALGLIFLGGLIGQATVEPEVRTVTVTEEVEVEVPGPTVVRSTPPEELPESCLAMIDSYLGQVDAIREYEAAIGGQSIALREAGIAIHQGDIGLINAAITEQSRIEAESTGPLQQLIVEQSVLDDLQARCEEEREGQ